MVATTKSAQKVKETRDEGRRRDRWARGGTEGTDEKRAQTS